MLPSVEGKPAVLDASQKDLVVKTMPQVITIIRGWEKEGKHGNQVSQSVS